MDSISSRSAINHNRTRWESARSCLLARQSLQIVSDSTINTPPRLHLRWLPGRFAVARLVPDAPIPPWAIRRSPFFSITRTDKELSIVAPQDFVPDNVTAERGFVAMRIVGKLDFSEFGILARLIGALADANISVVAISTYDTDYLLVRAADRARAETASALVGEFETASKGRTK